MKSNYLILQHNLKWTSGGLMPIYPPFYPKSRLIARHQTFCVWTKLGGRRISRYVVWLLFFFFFIHIQTVPYGGRWGFFFFSYFFLHLGRSLIFLDHRYYAGHENEGRRRKRTKDKGSAAHFLIRNSRGFSLFIFLGEGAAKTTTMATAKK